MRTKLFLAAGAVSLATVAGCSSSSDDSDDETHDDAGADSSVVGRSDASTTPADATTNVTDAASVTDADALTDADASPPLDAAPPFDAGFVPLLDGGPVAAHQRPISKDKTTAPNGYYEYLPAGYDGTVAAPLMVFWHGIGEDGDGLFEADGGGDLHLVPDNGPPKLIKANQWADTRPFVVLSPQHGPGGCPSSGEIDAFITWALAHYNVDPKRVYLTGLSCGAIGSWAYITQYKDKVVAATLLISGDPANAYSADGCSLVKDLALWSVHGSDDPTVNPTDDETEMPKFIACPEPRADVKFNLIDGGQHDVWTKTYDETYGIGDPYAWMLANPKP